MVQYDIRNAFILPVARYCHRRHLQRVREIKVNDDNAFCASLQQQPRIFLEQLGIVVVNAGNKEVAQVTGAIFNSRDDG